MILKHCVAAMAWATAASSKIARDAGYRTLFVSSVRAGWRGLDRVLQAQGFDEIIDANSLHEAYPEATLGLWGVWDDYVFRYLKTRMAKPSEKPLFVFVLTSTNHPPYDLPPEYKRVPRDMAFWKGETSSDTLLPNLDTYHYATDLLGGFVQAVSGGAMYRKTTFLLDSLGKRVFPKHIDILEDPFVMRGKGSSPFDDEGVTTRAKSIAASGCRKKCEAEEYHKETSQARP